MKIRASNEQGSVLLAALVILGLLALTLLATLNMVSTQRTITARAQEWNLAIPMAEAGVEDAMAHLNYTGTTNLGSDGWTLTTNGYLRTNTLSAGYYSTTISTDSAPIIVSQGYIFDGLKSNYLMRTVQVQTKVGSQFPDALLSKGPISMSGVPVIDSFNSTNALYSTGGKYDPAKAEANANVASLKSGAGVINVNDALIYGYVDTTPSGTVAINQGIVGDTAFVNTSGNATKIEPNHNIADVNTIVPDVVLPVFSPAPTGWTAITINGTNYDAGVLQGGNYSTNGNFAITGSHKMCVTAPSTLYVSNSFSVANSGYIYIASGASLTLYVGGPNCAISGAGIINSGLTSANCTIRCLPGCTNVTVAGSAGYVGTLYAPEATCTFSGGTASAGAFVGAAFVLTGSGAVHYDEALGGPTGYKYLVTGWQEL
jgi:Tfp pilus assembly protein PilX